MQMHVCASRGQSGHLAILELTVQSIVSSLTWVLRTQLGLLEEQ